ncbi:protein NRT1/ PTR FAMILY 1.1-like isoform X2 [Hevea brasiliensis]|uniref:protein NRT1/ PTR FAMILY 1.1-like isoform X2 n=1 Tax=Hevea brasiliensis TaxID=3981 RepID=UPI0025F41FC3|nr:protein NRT1/ PTR FAMILY 1.1-like isoform X2 [Hevea brasiliensis]XP_058000765.1 protein NRT1/ PTR FAMILY 1.1-like isoform X2 [Hevea brasiliensis]
MLNQKDDEGSFLEKQRMETTTDERNSTQELKRKNGGLRTMPFIIANETFEKVAGVGLQANMILYLQNEYNLSSATGATILFLWLAISYFTPIFGAFVSDSYLGRFRVIVLGTVVSLLGMILLWLTAIIPSARPPHCDQKDGNLQGCASPNAAQMVFLLSSFALMAIGAGGIRPCSLAFGADQFDKPGGPKNDKTLQSFFNWYYASVGMAVMVSVIFVVAIQDMAGWVVGFAVPVGFMLLSTVLFLMGSSRYIKVEANKSLLSSFAQVIAAAWKNRHHSLPQNDSDRWYHHKGSNLVVSTEKLSFLNKACVIKNPEKDLDSEGLAIDPWNLCTVKQVEELKALITVMPIWSTGIMISVTISQHAFPVLQAETMDRSFVGKAKIPAGSLGAFAILTLTIWVAIYDRILVPRIAKFTKRPRGLSNKQRIGIGLLLSCVSTAMAGAVEHQRRAMAIKQGLADKPKGVVNMSAMWLVPQHCLTGVSEALNAIGQIEFYYSQFPKTMSSIGVALFSLGMAFGNLLGSLIVAILSRATRNDGKASWVSNNLNRGHYDYYYWLLSFLSVLNFFYYLFCSKAYGSENNRIWDEGDTIEEEELGKQVGSPIEHAVV